MNLTVRPYVASDADAWDLFCSVSLQATFLHTRQFLSYHGERFQDRSLIIEESGKWLGLFPAALNLDDETCLVSHPGITYGGILHDGNLRGEYMLEAFTNILLSYRELGYSRLIYKAVPVLYHRSPAQDDLYALFRLGARRTRCDLSSTIDLKRRLQVTERRRRSLRKAVSAGVTIVQGIANLPALWKVLEDNLQSKHGVKPVHNFGEIHLLMERFPQNIRCIAAQKDSQIIAGIILFLTQTTHHSQYIASNKVGYEVSALDLVFETAIEMAIAERMDWFDFGISTESQGRVLNSGLYRFKNEFGGGGFVHEFYEIDL